MAVATYAASSATGPRYYRSAHRHPATPRSTRLALTFSVFALAAAALITGLTLLMGTGVALASNGVPLALLALGGAMFVGAVATFWMFDE